MATTARGDRTRVKKKHPVVHSGSQAIDITNIGQCIEDVRRAFLDGDTGPSEPSNFSQLLGRLVAARSKFPPLYITDFVDPYVNRLRDLGESGFTEILLSDPRRVRVAGLMFDIAQAILQRGEGFQKDPSNAFQQVVDDLYDGFLSAEDRKGVAPPENATDAPLVKFGNPQDGPYTWPIDATRNFDVRAAVVNLPPSHARRGLLGWAALGHETGGHDILHAYAGLEDQLGEAVREALAAQLDLNPILPDYWANRIDETASDVMGILNMGPAAAIGIIGYFRGLNAALGGGPHLRNDGPANDVHPADIVRGFLGASAVAQLSFDGAATWAGLLDEQTTRDIGRIVLENQEVSTEEARTSAQVVATTIINFKARTLEGHSLGDIQDWRNSDEAIVAQVRQAFRTATDVPVDSMPRIYAAHVVAAAVLEALAAKGDIPALFQKLIGILDAMHNANPSWGPLFVRHPGNLFRQRAFVRHSV
jgi:hypothetical protein